MKSVRPRTALLAAAVVDATGTGLFYPLSFVYIARITSLSVASIGLGLTLGTALALITGPLSGALVDRLGPRTVMMTGNVLAAGGYGVYLVVRSLPELIVAGFFVMSSDRFYWTSWPAYVGLLAEHDELDRWYAFVNAIKNGGVGAGALIASCALYIGGQSAVRGLLAADVASSLTAAAIVACAPIPRDAAEAIPPRAAARGGWRTVFRDRPFIILCLGFAPLSFGWLLPTLVVPAYLVSKEGLPVWMLSCVFAVSSLVVFSLQTRVTAAVSGIARVRLLAGVAWLFLGVIGLFALAGLVRGNFGIAATLMGTVVEMFAQMIAVPTVVALIAVIAPSSVLGRYMAVYQLTWSTSTTLGPLLVGTLADLGAFWLWPSFVMLVCGGGIIVTCAGRLLPAYANGGSG